MSILLDSFGEFTGIKDYKMTLNVSIYSINKGLK